MRRSGSLLRIECQPSIVHASRAQLNQRTKRLTFTDYIHSLRHGLLLPLTICYLHDDLLTNFPIIENFPPAPLVCVRDVVPILGMGYSKNQRWRFKKGFYIGVQLATFALEETMVQ